MSVYSAKTQKLPFTCGANISRYFLLADESTMFNDVPVFSNRSVRRLP